MTQQLMSFLRCDNINMPLSSHISAPFYSISTKKRDQLKNDIDKIKQCPDRLVFAGKTGNIYYSDI